MKIIVNGEPRQLAADTLFDLWQQEAGAEEQDPRRGFAMALNGALIRHDDWRTTKLAENDRVEIVRAMQGG